MGWFNIFKKSNSQNGSSLNQPNENVSIPEDVFIEKDFNPSELNLMTSLKGLDKIYYFLEQDFETKGFNDAIQCPEIEYKNNAIDLIKKQLNTLIFEAFDYYESEMCKIDAMINILERNGLIDTLTKAKVNKTTIEKKLDRLKEIQSTLEDMEKGFAAKAFMAYELGFKRAINNDALKSIQKINVNLSEQ